MKNLFNILILFLYAQTFAQPANDDCTSAETISVTTTSETTVNFETNGAIANNEIGCNGTTVSDYVDVWYEFIMPVNGNIYINGSISWNKFQILDACNGNEISCYNSSGFSYNLTIGNTYKLRVYRNALQVNNGYKSFKIQAFEQVTNDDCTNAETISVTTTSETTVNFETSGAIVNNELGCNGTTANDYTDVWYEFTMPVNGNIYINGSINWNRFQVLDACNGNEISCHNNSGFSYSLTAGNIYKLRVYRNASQANNGYKNFKIQAFEQVINDNCTNAETISVTTTSETIVNFEIRGAIANNEVGCNGTTANDYADVWYEFTMPVNGNVYIDGSISWNRFQVLDACNGNEISCHNNSGFSYSLTAGTSYKLRVFRTVSQAGSNLYKSFKIQAFEQVVNDNCTNAEDITVTTTSETTVNFEIRGAIANNEIGCNATTAIDYADVWYEFTMPVNGNIYIDGSISWNRFQVLDACNGNEISCFENNGFIYNLTAGNIYKLRLFRTVSQAGSNLYKSFKIQAIETATNDLCLDAINLSVGVYDEYVETKTLFGATASNELPSPSCGSFPTGEDVWFSVQIPSSGNLTIETTLTSGSTLNNTVIQIFEGSCSSLFEISCDDNAGNNNFSKISLTGRTPNEILYIRLFENGNDIADYYTIFAYDNNCTSTTIWNGSWSNLAPNNTKIAVFDANYNTSTASIDACLCKINNNTIFSIQQNDYLNIEHDLINNGQIIIEPKGSLVQVDTNSTIIGNGSFTTKIDTNSLIDTRYTYFSSPIQSAQIAVFNSWAQTNSIYDFNNVTQNWRLVNSSTSMTPGKGFIVRPPNPIIPNNPPANDAFIGSTAFNGTLNNGDISHSITYNAGGSDDDNELVGNPYPSAIVTATLFSDNPRVNALYFWTHDNAGLANGWVDDYAIYNGTGYTAGNASTPAPTNIASGQGFFVVANSGANPSPQITFKNSQRIKDQNTNFLRPTNSNLNKIWLNLSNNSGVNNQILIGFNPICSDGYDNQYDAAKFDSGSLLSFYSTGNSADTEKLAIQTRNIIENDDVIIPLGFEVVNTSTLTISIDHFENLTDVDVILKDNLLNIFHNLKNSNYSFTNTVSGNINQRFELVFKRNVLKTGQYNFNSEQLIILTKKNDIYVKTLKNNIINKFTVYNLLGKQLFKSSPNKLNVVFNISAIKQGSLLIIKVKLVNGETLYKKFVKI